MEEVAKAESFVPHEESSFSASSAPVEQPICKRKKLDDDPVGAVAVQCRPYIDLSQAVWVDSWDLRPPKNKLKLDERQSEFLNSLRSRLETCYESAMRVFDDKDYVGASALFQMVDCYVKIIMNILDPENRQRSPDPVSWWYRP